MRFAILLLAAALAGAAPKKAVLWRDPGRVEALDFYFGPGGRATVPTPPFTFVREETEGTYPKVRVRDRRGREWVVKFGREVQAEPFASRIAWAAGYYVQPVHFVRRGVIRGAHGLKRAGSQIGSGGAFRDARFQLRDPGVRLVEGHNWAWVNNPFQGSREIAGLQVVMMLVSNWDNKDARDVEAGVNTGIFETGNQLIYAFTDWGATMGHWGGVARRSSWNCSDFADDTPHLIRVKDNRIEWGYQGRHNESFTEAIGIADVAWVMRYLGRIREGQIRDGLRASGATRAETDCFAREMRRRLDALKAWSSSPQPGAAR